MHKTRSNTERKINIDLATFLFFFSLSFFLSSFLPNANKDVSNENNSIPSCLSIAWLPQGMLLLLTTGQALRDLQGMVFETYMLPVFHWTLSTLGRMFYCWGNKGKVFGIQKGKMLGQEATSAALNVSFKFLWSMWRKPDQWQFVGSNRKNTWPNLWTCSDLTSCLNARVLIVEVWMNEYRVLILHVH